MPQDVPSTSDRHLIELENQVQCLMEAHLAPNQPIQLNKITFSCEIYSGPHETQYCMENLEQAFVEYVSSRTDEVGALGWHLEEIHVTWAHLEKKRTRLRTYIKSLEESCSQSVETASQA
ncbi:hypothetical protein Tco_1046043 [Tanacetum coccineum]